ncbi:MAG: hypothetical protein QOH93_501 [Chloroflexia bacterium]|jgi:hypothetical protein|nr:hypothetical protein [Chloroflexia bacterium]
MNIRVSKLYQGSPWGALEVAFNADPEGDKMIVEIAEVTGLSFKRPPANLFAMRELHIAEVGGEEALERAFIVALEVAGRYGEVQDSQKNMKGPGELTPNQLSRNLPEGF